ncbi:MAG: Bcr/CflA family drug resistance efflux transporter, partial [Candidatus Polarisedimenticolia bacterium]
SVLSARLAAAVPPRRQILAGLSTVAAASAALVAVVRLRLPAAWTITAITIAFAGLGFVLGNATSAAVAAAPRAAGAASALLGALQFGFGAAVAPLVGLWGDRTAVPMAVAMTVAGLGALASFLVADGAERAARRGRCAEASAA